MFRIHTAVLTAMLALAVTSLGAAQTATDSTRRDLKQDNRAFARDTVKLNQDIAMRDSVRATLAQERNRMQVGDARIDSLQSQLDRARKATPRDSAAIKRDETALANARKAQDREIDRYKQEMSRLKLVEAKVRKESDTTIDVHRDIKQDRASVRAHGNSSHH
jgi:hypothetical protein